MTVRRRTDEALREWALLMARFRWPAIVGSFVLTAGLLTGLRAIEIETSTESFLQQHDPARIRYDAFRAEFGNDDTTIVTLEADDVFDPVFLERLVALHQDLVTSLPYVEEVTSLLNARVTYGRDDALVVEDLLEGWPLDADAVRRARARAVNNPVYRNALISEAGRHTSLTVDILPGNGGIDSASRPDVPHMLATAERESFVAALQGVLTRHEREDFPVWVTGRQPVASAVLAAMRADMKRFTALALGLIATVLFVLFRRVSGVVLPLLTVGLAVSGTFGVMGLVGVEISPTTQILPSFLLAVGVGDAVHILAIYYHRLDGGSSWDDALAFAYAHSGFAVVMTSVTTATCLMSFLFADMPPVSGLGFAAVVGVMLALAYTLVLLPALIAVLPNQVGVASERSSFGIRTDRILAAISGLATTYPWTVVAVWSASLALAIFGMARLHFELNPVEWFRTSHPTRASIETINRTMRAGGSYEVIVDSGREKGLYEPEVMRRIDAMREQIETSEIAGFRAGRVISIVDVLKETHRALNENDPAFYDVPDDHDLIAQELLLFELSGSDDMEELIDNDYRKARMTVLVPVLDGFNQGVYMEAMRARLEEIAGDVVDLEITGYSHIGASTNRAMVTSTARSYAIALVTLVPLMMFLTGSVWRGILSMIPNIVPVVMSLGLMYLLDIPLDVFTILIGSIAIGVAVDDTIHFIHNYRRYMENGHDARSSVRETMLSTGRALFVTSVVLAIGFLVFMGAVMVNVVDFGLITAFTVVTAFLADATLTPALLVLVADTGAGRASTVV